MNMIDGINNWLRDHRDLGLGLIKQIDLFPIKHGQHTIFQGIALTGSPSVLRSTKDAAPDRIFIPSGMGFHEDAKIALLSASIEAVERYSASVWFQDELVSASAQELNEMAADLSDFVLKYPVEFSGTLSPPYAKFSTATKRDWLPAKDLFTNKLIYVPAQATLFDYYPRSREEYVFINSSNGLAASTTQNAALLGAIYEVIERDSFMCHWLNLVKPNRIPFDACHAALSSALFEPFNKSCLSISFFGLENNYNLPVITCYIRDRENNVFGIGASCKSSFADSVRKAAYEAILCYYTSLKKVGGEGSLELSSDIACYFDHVRFFTHPNRIGLLDDFFSNSPGSVPYSFIEKDEQYALHDVVKQTGALGKKIYAANLSRDDAMELGIHVVKVFISGMQPLHLSDDHPYDLRRLKDFMLHYGGSNFIYPEFWIHPFP